MTEANNFGRYESKEANVWSTGKVRLRLHYDARCLNAAPASGRTDSRQSRANAGTKGRGIEPVRDIYQQTRTLGVNFYRFVHRRMLLGNYLPSRSPLAGLSGKARVGALAKQQLTVTIKAV
jgi:hypothetical protein